MVRCRLGYDRFCIVCGRNAEEVGRWAAFLFRDAKSKVAEKSRTTFLWDGDRFRSDKLLGRLLGVRPGR